jgi:leucyl aminopeptidase
MNTIQIINKETIKTFIHDAVILIINELNDLHNNALLENKIKSDELITLLQKKEFDPKKEMFKCISIIVNNNVFKIIIIGYQNNTLQTGYENFKNNLGKAIAIIQNDKIASVCVSLAFSITAVPAVVEKIGELFQSTVLLKTYQFKEFITDPKKILFTQFTLSVVLDDNQAAFENGIKKGAVIGESINFSRHLSDLPAYDLYPESFINNVKEQLAAKNIICEIEIFDFAKLKELKMGGIVGVGQGSTKLPYLLILKYTPKEASQQTVAIVGKGVTFDTGGISIKPSEGMEDMKADMSGAATTVATFMGLAQLQSPYTIYAVTPLAENMVDGNAIRPGDILRFYNGKTAEIKNTDAEGRLILADALSYVSDKIKPQVMIDLATLTGACRIALGPVYAGLMTENALLENKIKAAGEVSGDRCWSLPLEDAYKPNMASDVADMCNIGTKGYKAGTTMGGMFLREFVDKNIMWAHLDIATVATECPFKSYIPSHGATGFGVHLLLELLQSKEYLG